MIQATNLIELNKHCAAAVGELNAVLNNFSDIFKNLPIGENIKNKRLQTSVKEKAAWYACLVNPNIDILLLPDYFESRQSRNILLKKETDQFQLTVNRFAELKHLSSNVAIFENLLTHREEELSEFDLFAKHIKPKEKCPEALTKQFDQWMMVSIGESELENLMHHFCNWHSLNNFSFTNQRNFILWFNFQLWKLFGDAGLLFNIEQYFFHHWNKESRSYVQSLKELTQFLQESCVKLQSEMKTIYREELSYEAFEPQQKIANNFIYHLGFNFPLKQVVNAEDYSIQLNKVMLKKGFVRSSDINFKVQLEKVKLTLQNWYATGLVNVVFNESGWFAYLLPIEQKTKRLDAFCNLQYNVTEPQWDLVFAKPIISFKPKEVSVVEEPVKVSRQKAFFG